MKRAPIISLIIAVSGCETINCNAKIRSREDQNRNGGVCFMGCARVTKIIYLIMLVNFHYIIYYLIITNNQMLKIMTHC